MKSTEQNKANHNTTHSQQKQQKKCQKINFHSQIHVISGAKRFVRSGAKRFVRSGACKFVKSGA